MLLMLSRKLVLLKNLDFIYKPEQLQVPQFDHAVFSYVHTLIKLKKNKLELRLTSGVNSYQVELILG